MTRIGLLRAGALIGKQSIQRSIVSLGPPGAARQARVFGHGRGSPPWVGAAMGWRQTRLIRSRRSYPPSACRQSVGVTDTLRLHNHRTDKETIKKD